jgi:hypothetical protein
MTSQAKGKESRKNDTFRLTISLVDKCDTSQEAFDKFTDKLGLD